MFRHLRPTFSLIALSALLWSTGCKRDRAAIDDVDPIGSLAGSFACMVIDGESTEVDLGFAEWSGDLDVGGYESDLRNQGCFARLDTAERGPIITATLFQQTGFGSAQVLALSFPLGEDDDRIEHGDEVYFSRNGGFASVYRLNAADDADVLARNAGGVVFVDQAGTELGEIFAGTFDDLRMGAL